MRRPADIPWAPVATGNDAPALPLSGLTAAQHEAVGADDPVVCVLAGAGAGKTRVLTLRVARRALDGSAHPMHTLVCTFSRKAAGELGNRLWGLGVGSEVQAGTFHRTAWRLLRQRCADQGWRVPVLLIDRRPLVAEILDGPAGPRVARRGGPGAGPGQRSAAVRLDAEIAWAKARLVGPDTYPAAALAAGRRAGGDPERVAAAFARYEEARRRRGLVDMDDLLRVAGDLLEDPAFATAVRWRHRHLYVDEMQDLNDAQFRLLCLLAGEEPDLFVVGDPNQSVYGWNGADPRLLDRVPELFPGTRVLRLDANHRCSPQVVRTAASVLSARSPRRSAAADRGNTTDDTDDTDGGGGSGAAGQRGADAPAPVSTRTDGPVPRVVRFDDDDAEATWVAHQVWLAHRPGTRWTQIAVLARTNAQLVRLGGAFEAGHIPYRTAGAELGPASDLTTGRDERSDPRLFDPVPPDDNEDEPPPADSVTLTTFHRAKGLEWPTVFVVGLSDGLVPVAGARSREARAEERRLLYVALTRAERDLTCTWAEQRSSSGEPSGRLRRPSPWLAAIEAAVATLAAESAAGDPAAAARHLARIRAGLAPAPEPPSDI